jgi:hypothetical protein
MEHSTEIRSGVLFADRPGRSTGARSRVVDVGASQRVPVSESLQETRAWNALLGDPPLSSAELAALSTIARTRVVPRGASVFTA